MYTVVSVHVFEQRTVLPRGRNAARREVVYESQHRRLLAAMVEAVAEKRFSRSSSRRRMRSSVLSPLFSPPSTPAWKTEFEALRAERPSPSSARPPGSLRGRLAASTG